MKNLLYMRRVPSVLIVFVLCLVSAACSVKEDRRECPCRLMLDFRGIDTSLVTMLNIYAMSADGIVFSDTVAAEDFSRMYIRDVPHTLMRVSLWGADGGSDRLHIPYGLECPLLYMYSFDADTRAETYFREVNLMKNHCRLSVLFSGREQMPYRLTFRGNVDGYGTDGMPSDGDFACVAYPADTEGLQVVLPRQMDSSLLLDIEDEDTSVLKTFAIGEYLMKGGYDWSAENLEDVTVVLDYYITGINITYKGWDKEYSYDIIL